MQIFPYNIFNLGGILFLSALMFLCEPEQLTQINPHEPEVNSEVVVEDSLSHLINDFVEGFKEENFDRIRNALGISFIMFNGNYSGNPQEWQAHQYLHGEEIDEWVRWMLKNVSPFTNSHTIEHFDIKNNCAIIVTKETGKNAYRQWDNEQVTYLIGKVNKKWKIVGFYLKDMKNPED